MRRSIGAAAAAILLVAVLLVPAALALAKDPSYAGTYKGVGTGKNKKGKKGSSGATVWVEDLGDTVRFTFRFDKLPVVVDIETPEEQTQNGISSSFTIKKMGVRGSATITLSLKGETWTMLGSGSGKAAKYEGSGKLVCTRVSTGVEVPSIREEVSDLFSALAGGKPKSSTSTTPATSAGAGSGGSTPKPTATPTPEVTVKPVSSLAPAKPKPPVPDDDMFLTTGAVLLIVTMSIAFGFNKPGKGL